MSEPQRLVASNSKHYIESHMQTHSTSRRTAERHLQNTFDFPAPLTFDALRDERRRPLKKHVSAHLLETYRRRRWLALFLQLGHSTQDGSTIWVANDARQARYWIKPTNELETANVSQLSEAQQKQHFNDIQQLLCAFSRAAQTNIIVWPHAEVTRSCRALVRQRLHSSDMPIVADNQYKIYLPLAAYYSALYAV